MILFPFSPPAPVACEFFLLAECPAANQFSKEIGRIIREYSKKGVKFTLYLEDQEARIQPKSYAKAFNIPCPVVRDTQLKEARRIGADISPTAAVLVQGSTVYLGRIDDRYPKLGVLRAPTTFDLRIALDSALKLGKTPLKKVPAVGCSF